MSSMFSANIIGITDCEDFFILPSCTRACGDEYSGCCILTKSSCKLIFTLLTHGRPRLDNSCFNHEDTSITWTPATIRLETDKNTRAMSIGERRGVPCECQNLLACEHPCWVKRSQTSFDCCYQAFLAMVHYYCDAMIAATAAASACYYLNQ